MTEVGRPYTSGNWMVKQGQEDEFVTRWTRFTRWAQKEADGASGFVLIREGANPRHFVSFGEWADAESVSAWRSRPEFAELLASCRELCEEFQPGDYVVAASVRP